MNIAFLLILGAALCVPAPIPAVRITPIVNNGRTSKTPRDGPVDYFQIAADIELFSACLRAGRSITAAVDIVAATYTAAHDNSSPATQQLASAWRTASSLHALGATTDTAWQELATIPGLKEVAALVKLSATSGASLADGCARIAISLHDDAADNSTARAERAGVLISIPLALCFLPAFFALGLAPVVISLGAELMS
ncbi:type II secretion system F family protein [Corynebacterium lubricantis]|uniref:type II secretion system F family protein n=1 Tax=Corynebacterium lubricantis TaxID=541095 RepID=UPI000376B3D3|nr:type II secretion system F family protein [Corynebacterium lubricantis]